MLPPRRAFLGALAVSVKTRSRDLTRAVPCTLATCETQSRQGRSERQVGVAGTWWALGLSGEEIFFPCFVSPPTWPCPTPHQGLVVSVSGFWLQGKIEVFFLRECLSAAPVDRANTKSCHL